MAKEREDPVVRTVSFEHPQFGNLVCTGYSAMNGDKYLYNQDRICDGHGFLPITADYSGGMISEFVILRLYEAIKSRLFHIARPPSHYSTLPPSSASQRTSVVMQPENKISLKHKPTSPALTNPQTPTRFVPFSSNPDGSPKQPHSLRIDDRMVKQILIDAFKQANDELMEHLRKHKILHKNPGGCTAISMVLLGNTLYTASVGDSAAFLGGYDIQHISYVRLTRKHDWAWEDEMIRIKRHSGHFVRGPQETFLVDSNEQNCVSISRSIGDIEFEPVGLLHVPDVSRQDIETWRDFVLIAATDGILDVMSKLDCVETAGCWFSKLIVDGADEGKKHAVSHTTEQITNHAVKAIVQQAENRWEKRAHYHETNNITFVMMYLPHIRYIAPPTPQDPLSVARSSRNIMKHPTVTEQIKPAFAQKAVLPKCLEDMDKSGIELTDEKSSDECKSRRRRQKTELREDSKKASISETKDATDPSEPFPAQREVLSEKVSDNESSVSEKQAQNQRVHFIISKYERRHSTGVRPMIRQKQPEKEEHETTGSKELTGAEGIPSP
ncbi:putative Protein phosphatase 2C [Blattamonas nauphoetae]|uniref:PPM-type phosphatase domain-containing protein n=1 Tax=Blattamonas nauphoetae TaxID=2049346 RepID=A0ABQ9XZ15_9EUKA|nr:putative Protein phosphatase 2C [Blattamonas nauphoetae]